jgi:CheY-like chemotaxis protein
MAGVPIIALSANLADYNLPEKMSAGIDRFIDKSSNDRHSLMTTVRTLLGAPNSLSTA